MVGWIRSKIMLFLTPSNSRHPRGIDHPLCFVFHINRIFSIGLAVCHGLHAATHATQAPSPCLSARDGTRSPTGVQRSLLGHVLRGLPILVTTAAHVERRRPVMSLKFFFLEGEARELVSLREYLQVGVTSPLSKTSGPNNAS